MANQPGIFRSRVVETRGGFCFSHESLAHVGPKREIGRKKLYRHVALEPRVAGAVDDSGATASNLALYLVCRSQPSLDARAKIALGCGLRWVGQAVCVMVNSLVYHAESGSARPGNRNRSVTKADYSQVTPKVSPP